MKKFKFSVKSLFGPNFDEKFKFSVKSPFGPNFDENAQKKSIFGEINSYFIVICSLEHELWPFESHWDFFRVPYIPYIVCFLNYFA